MKRQLCGCGPMNHKWAREHGYVRLDGVDVEALLVDLGGTAAWEDVWLRPSFRLARKYLAALTEGETTE